MKKPRMEQLTQEQHEAVVELFQLLRAANQMPVIIALLENLLERRILTGHLKKLTEATKWN